MLESLGVGSHRVILRQTLYLTLSAHGSYRMLDEIVWVKTNQIGGLIRTGRTGHWLNHSKGKAFILINF